MNCKFGVLLLILSGIIVSYFCAAPISQIDSDAAQSDNASLPSPEVCDLSDSYNQKGDLVACNTFLDSVDGQGQGYSFLVEDGQLEVSVSRPYTPIFMSLSDDIKEGVAAVIDVHTSKNNLGTGLVCSYQDQEHYYAFLFTEDNGYGIAKKSPESLEYLANGFLSHAPNNNAVRQVEIHCQKGALSLYVDGFYINSVYDTEYESGQVGLFIQSFDDVPESAIFDNFAAFVSSP